MSLTYGIAKVGGDGGDFAFDEDLGIPTWGPPFGKKEGPSTVYNSLDPNKEMISQADIVNPGAVYSVGSVLCSTTGGTGTGAQVLVRTDQAAGNLSFSILEPTAGFTNWQNSTISTYNVAEGLYSYIRDTATGENTVSGTTAAVATAGGTGAGVTVLLTITNGSITKITPADKGKGYKVGEILTVPAEKISSAAQAVNGGSPVAVLGDLTIVLNDYNITGNIIEIIEFTNGGSGYTVGDVLTLQEIGSDQTGEGEIEVTQLDLGLEASVAIDYLQARNIMYPRAIRVSEGTVDDPKTIEFITFGDENVIIPGFIAGSIFPFTFREIVSKNTDVSVQSITILY